MQSLFSERINKLLWMLASRISISECVAMSLFIYYPIMTVLQRWDLTAWPNMINWDAFRLWSPHANISTVLAHLHLSQTCPNFQPIIVFCKPIIVFCNTMIGQSLYFASLKIHVWGLQRKVTYHLFVGLSLFYSPSRILQCCHHYVLMHNIKIHFAG